MIESIIFSLSGALLGGLIISYSLKLNKKNDATENEERIKLLEKENYLKEETIKNITSKKNILEAKIEVFEQIKIEKTQIEERLKLVEIERNNLKNDNTRLAKEEENRNETLRKSIASTNILQENLRNEIARVNDERVKKEQEKLESMKLNWSNHEKDIQNHIRLICKNHVINYIGQEDFPYPRNKPDNSIKIMDQLIVFDAKSPANENLSNFPKYIKDQTENLKKYAKHEDVKKDLFLVIPSNTLSVINQFTYNIGDYNVNVITKDALEPIILSLKKIEEYEFADKLSPHPLPNVKLPLTV